MKFKLKALAAVAFAAIAGQASASLTVPSTSTGQSDLIFFALDLAGSKSFAYDLGSPAVITPGFTQNITGSAWSQYLAAENNSLASTTWGLAYVQGTVGQADANELIGTTLLSTVAAPVNFTTNIKLDNGLTAFTDFLAATSITAAGGSAFVGTTTNDNYAGHLANKFALNYSKAVDNAVGTASKFYSVGVTANGVTPTLLATGVNFDGTNVSVAAVPEPETYGMLAAGLLMLGAIARRRKV